MTFTQMKEELMYADYDRDAPFTGWAWAEFYGGYAEERFICSTRAEVREFSNWRMTLRDLAEFVGGI